MQNPLDAHESRMNEILSRKAEDNTSILAYISGYMGDNKEFEEAFGSALLHSIFID